MPGNQSPAHELYELNIDLNVLNHLGLNLYSNVPAVLAELIANAWDADATKVHVTVSRGSYGTDDTQIVIADDGRGMDDADLRGKYLTVGYQRRRGSNGDRTPGGRHVMGRKGIGKLSIFSVAGKACVYTRKAGRQPLGIELDVARIQDAIEHDQKYHPNPIDVHNGRLGPTGTVIELSKLKKRVNASLDAHLRQRVARRFSIVSSNFEVSIDGAPITIGDRNYFGKLENAFVYGNFDKSRFSHERKYIVTRSAVVDQDAGYRVRGWLGLVRESGTLQEGADNLNKIAVLARGKVALEDILDRFREGGLYTKYVIGEIEADFLDETSLDDIATSSRQDFIQSDDRFVALSTFVRKELAALKESRARMKADEGERRAVEIPAIGDWYGSLRSDARSEAKKLFGKINQIATDEDHRKTLYKHGVLAFEHLRHKEKLSELGDLDVNNLEAAVKLFSELDDIEASWYYQITQGRLDVIRKLRELTDDDALEKVVQEHIYSHLWLLDPSWDRATETPSMERTVRADFERLSKRLTADERNGRLDIRYKKTSGKHVIVELKRASVRLRSLQLADQVQKYMEALRKQIDEHGEHGPIEAVCLVGHSPTNWRNSNRQDQERILDASNIRIVTYRELIKDAETSYREYLAKAEDRGRIKALLDAIDESA